MISIDLILASINPEQTTDSGTYLSEVQSSDISVFASLFNLYASYNSEFSERMVKHWVSSWLCTDTVVGVSVYCLDKIPVAISLQPARKSDENIFFISTDTRDAVLKAVLAYQEIDMSDCVLGEGTEIDSGISETYFSVETKKYGVNRLRAATV